MTRPLQSASPSASWLGRGAWTVLDQGLFAGANFAVNILLARWLTPEAYGAFTVGFIVFLLVGALHGGLLVEPMLVFGAGRFKRRTAAYLRALLAEHVRFSGLAALALALAAGLAALAGQAELAAVFAVLVGAQAVVLFLWLMRRACYVVFQPAWAAIAGAVYLALVVSGAFLLEHTGRLSGPTALGLMSAGALVAGAGLAWKLGVRPEAAPPDLAKEAREAHVGYGRWAAATGAVEWTHNAWPFLVLPVLVGLAASGTLRALYNLAMPALQAFSALTILAVPAFVHARQSGRLRPVVLKTSVLLGALGLANALALGLFGGPIVDWLYRGQYEASAAMLLLLAGLPLASAASGVLMAVLRSAERPRAVFRARAGAAAATTTVGTGLAALFGVAGALAADLVGLLMESVLMARALAKGEGRGPRPRASGADRAGGDGAGEWPAGEAFDLSDASFRAFAEASAPKNGEGGASRRLRVLVSAFACEPGEGSEQGVGWGVARALAEKSDVWVLVHTSCVAGLAAELRERPVPGLHVISYALPWERRAYRDGAQKRGGLGEQMHYYLWQLGAARVARSAHKRAKFDVAQHVTYVKYWAPSALAWVPVPYVWGPVGGGEATPKAFYPDFSAEGRRYERLRDWAQRIAHLDPNVRRTARRAAIAFATSDETAARMRRLGAGDVRVMSSVALTDDDIAALGALPPPPDGPLHLLCVGRFLQLKGFDYALRAFALAARLDREAARAEGRAPSLSGARLTLIGDGPERARLEALAHELGLLGPEASEASSGGPEASLAGSEASAEGWAEGPGPRAVFAGRLPRAGVLAALGASHGLVHPSFHDSGGYATLEAMGAGRAVVCLALGGPGRQVGPDGPAGSSEGSEASAEGSVAGVAVAAENPAQVERALAHAVVQLGRAPSWRAALGRAGQARVRERYRWPVLVDALHQAHLDLTAPRVSRTRRRVLVSAFACEPGRGSEQSQGWAYAREAARTSDVWVLAHEASRAALEAELRERPVPGLRPVFYALPWETEAHRQGKARRRGVREQAHYYFWQLGAGRLVRRLDAALGFDLSHHVSYMRCWSPAAAARVAGPFVWGPVGGGESAPRAFYPGFSPAGRRYERLRDLARTLARFDPLTRHTARRAAVALATTEQSAALMRRLGARDVEVATPVALADAEVEALAALPRPPEGPLHLLCVGRLVHWKGFDYGLRSFALAARLDREAALAEGRAPALRGARLTLIGDGPERARLEALAADLGLLGPEASRSSAEAYPEGYQASIDGSAPRAVFAGRLPRAGVLAALGRAHGLVHPSFHDSGGYATLEAMGAGRAVVCLALGGPGRQVGPDGRADGAGGSAAGSVAGVAVAAEGPAQVERELAEAIVRLAWEPSWRGALGRAGQERVRKRYRTSTVLPPVIARYDALVPLSLRPDAGSLDMASPPLSRVEADALANPVAV